LPLLAFRAGGGGSGCRILDTPSTDARYETASIASVSAGPTADTSVPPIGGPSAFAVQDEVSSRLSASARFSLGTNDLRCAPLAAWNVTSAAVWITLTAYSCAIVTTCSAVATATLVRAANLTMSAATITGRFRRNSTAAPDGTAISAPAKADTAASNDTSAVDACKVSTATSGSAPYPIALPASLVAVAHHSRRNPAPSSTRRP
jgi:hypothetical protein